MSGSLVSEGVTQVERRAFLALIPPSFASRRWFFRRIGAYDGYPDGTRRTRRTSGTGGRAWRIGVSHGCRRWLRISRFRTWMASSDMNGQPKACAERHREEGFPFLANPASCFSMNCPLCRLQRYPWRDGRLRPALLRFARTPVQRIPTVRIRPSVTAGKW